ncbi:MAG: transcription-repair coupling factor [Planctomycetes bacterium]|nr:transcription-repair coupling factor [Planctomycetota bacterium]
MSTATGTMAPREQRAAVVLDPTGFELPELERLARALERDRHVLAGNLWGSSQALVLAWLASRAQGPWVVTTAGEAEAQGFADDLAAFGAEPAWLPAREGVGTALRTGEADLTGLRARLQVAQRLAGPPEARPRLLVASLVSMLQPVQGRAELEREWLALQVGGRLDAEGLLERLVASGYQRTPLAERPGEVSLRGEILDLYPFASELPLRVELFGEEIESLRTFDPVDQRSVEKHERVQVSLASDAGGIEDGRGELPASLMGATAVFVRVEPLRLEDRAGGLRIQSAGHARALLELEALARERRRLDLQSLPGGLPVDTRSVQALGLGMREAPEALRAAAADGTRVVVLCQTPAEEARFAAILAEGGAAPGVETRVGSLARGFRLPAARLVVVNHRELLGIVGRRTPARAREPHKVRALQSFFELKVGDLVVHAVHGLARFAGLKRMERSGGEEEHLHLLFADEVSLFVPAARIDLVQRYIGTGSGSPPLDRIGSSSFRKRKEKVERAIRDLATELLEVQARRALRARAPWAGAAGLLAQMIESFPWTETADQVAADAEIAADLAAERPMDRLLCGDVGFGKTELAIRAAFRVACGGGQVAVLVPTTVLASQHEATFRERLADFPVEVASLSRHVAGKEERSILERVAKGEVDILIGTHRILSKDVVFARLGLVIVDEEQRFGVTHKEHFKKLRATIDLLTLSATPIPRTLHMSLSGLRDISALTIPPEGRQEIETVLGFCEDDGLIREALLREKNRGGQVFFLHNRVHSIEALALRIQRLVPECSYAIGHGQMPARELKRVMEAFISGAVDVLVSTTIVESGIDIPAAGTIVIDHADEFGLAELHQLRGRVGRGTAKSHCYLLVEQWKPLRDEAKERLKALEELTRLGAGFQISMKDLEIRGAGNLLGPEQSGHIAAVGYDMYCRLLHQTTEKLRAGGEVDVDSVVAAQEAQGAELELGISAYLPDDWIADARARVEVLRQLSAIHDDDEMRRAVEGLKDRFGRVPEPALALARLFRLKARLEEIGVRRLSWRQDVYVLEYADRVALEGGLDLVGVELRPIRTGVLHLVVPPERRTGAQALQWFERLLRRAPPATTMPRPR